MINTMRNSTLRKWFIQGKSTKQAIDENRIELSGYRNLATSALFYLFLIAAILFLFYRFTVQNTERIQAQNRSYALDATQQKAERLAGQFSKAKELIGAYAFFVGHTILEPDVSSWMLKEMEERATFDAITFTDLKGKNLSSRGIIKESNNKEFFKNGVSGNTGITVVFNSRIFDQTVLVFYAPVKFENRIIGVLHGSYLAEKYLYNMLESTYFGKPSDSYLCKPNGEIIASNNHDITSGHILEVLVNKKIINREVSRDAAEIFRNGGSGVFTCSDNSHTDNLSLTYVPGYDFVLVQTFPETVTESMVENANRAGIELESMLLCLFILYAAFILIRNHAQKKRLKKENTDFSWVINGLNNLFSSRYCIVDLKDGEYFYITADTEKNKNSIKNGNYSNFMHKYAEKVIGQKARQEFIEFFSRQNVVLLLQEMDTLIFECPVLKDGREEWEHIIVISVEREERQPVRALIVSQNVTAMKHRELQANKKISILNRKENEYRLAISSNARSAFEFNVSKDLLEEDLLISEGENTYSVLKEFNITLPCKMSEVFTAISCQVCMESRKDFDKIMNVEFLKEIYENGKKEIDIDFWRHDAAGGEICVRQAFYIMRDETSGDIMAMTVGRDITTQVKEQHNQRKALEDALLAAQNASRAKSTFLSNMSHDIRTPMNAIIGFATIAATHPDNKVQVQECLKKVLSSSNHLLSLINDILDMSRIESGKMQMKMQECNISEIVHNLINIIQPQAKAKKMHLSIDICDVINEKIIADPLKLNQVFINLLSNAIKYTPAKGLITFRISQQPAMRHGYGDYLFEIMDNGQGMTPEFVEHIFEPFTRESTTTLTGIEGTGLGMAITKNIVDLLNGTIEVESEPGKGSIFKVKLALKLQESQADIEDLKQLAGMRILVVDDDFNVCDSVDKMLKKLGLRSDWTTSGEEAVYRAQIAKKDGIPYDAFILDWQMPGLSGIETASKIRSKIDENVPIIILTAYEWSDIEEEARKVGVSFFCAKPMFLSDLKTALLSIGKNNGIKSTKIESDATVFENARILVVDDVEMNREIAQFVLEESGFTVEIAEDGSDAVHMVNDSPDAYYDAILMDVQMPTMNGYEATRAIRNLQRKDVQHLPIIAMTANALEEDREQALKAGMNAHIAKPIDIKNFYEVLGKYFHNK